ncbi:hypothetical protein GMRT_12331 [Giardia muris]|uniref:Uncharacterized protein n=1 Tax=Giardia muris TaxID=5742 RepID=A0A4Z1T7A0_GIAMU|nr:hypothetical protein GMRT_12331 [Giardia muris]|eukprot:TNJ28371.1 hypothetical protein GMRT_12331 [Giardia muris]
MSNTEFWTIAFDFIRCERFHLAALLGCLLLHAFATWESASILRQAQEAVRGIRAKLPLSNASTMVRRFNSVTFRWAACANESVGFLDTAVTLVFSPRADLLWFIYNYFYPVRPWAIFEAHFTPRVPGLYACLIHPRAAAAYHQGFPDMGAYVTEARDSFEPHQGFEVCSGLLKSCVQALTKVGLTLSVIDILSIRDGELVLQISTDSLPTTGPIAAQALTEVIAYLLTFEPIELQERQISKRRDTAKRTINVRTARKRAEEAADTLSARFKALHEKLQDPELMPEERKRVERQLEALDRKQKLLLSKKYFPHMNTKIGGKDKIMTK